MWKEINVKVPSPPSTKAAPSVGYDMSKNILHVCYKYVDIALSIINQWIPFYLLKQKKTGIKIRDWKYLSFVGRVRLTGGSVQQFYLFDLLDLCNTFCYQTSVCKKEARSTLPFLGSSLYLYACESVLIQDTSQMELLLFYYIT